jgi:hypothetical protein
MLLLRDKSGFATRKIMDKARITVPSFTGELLWRWVQEYIFRTSKPSQDINENTHRCHYLDISDTLQIPAPEPGGNDRVKAVVLSHNTGSHQHDYSATSPAGIEQ